MNYNRDDSKEIYNLQPQDQRKYSLSYPLDRSWPAPFESMPMFRYLMYKKKLYNMESKRLPKITSNSSQNSHLCLKRG